MKSSPSTSFPIEATPRITSAALPTWLRAGTSYMIVFSPFCRAHFLRMTLVQLLNSDWLAASDPVQCEEPLLVDGRIIHDPALDLHPGVTEERGGAVADHEIRGNAIPAEQSHCRHRSLQAKSLLP